MRKSPAKIVTGEQPLRGRHYSDIRTKSCRWEWGVAASVENILQDVFQNPQECALVHGDSIYDWHPVKGGGNRGYQPGMHGAELLGHGAGQGWKSAG